MSRCVPVQLALAIAAIASRATAGPPYLTDDPEPPPFGHSEAIFFTTGLEAGGAASGVLPAMEFNYGGFEDTQLHILLPLAFSAGGGKGAKFGASDAELGVKYRFVEEDAQGWRPQVASYPVIEIPMAPARNGFASRSVDAFVPVWAQKDLDENWTVDAGGGYWINPGDRNFWISGVLLQRKLGEALVVGAEVFHRTPNTTDGLALTGLNVGATYDFSEHHHLLVSAGRGLRNASAADQFTWFLGFEFTN